MRSACLAALLLATLAPSTLAPLAGAAQPPLVAAGPAEHTVLYSTAGYTDCAADTVALFTYDTDARIGTLRAAAPGPGQAACPFLGETYFPGQCALGPGDAVACGYTASWGSDNSTVTSLLTLAADGALVYDYTYANTDSPELPSYHRRIEGLLLRA